MDDVHSRAVPQREESYLLVVDSRMRDTSTYATPSEYRVQFNSPFRHVVGLDVLDASIPRTEYIVDETRNVLEYATTHPVDLDAWRESGVPKKTVRIDPGDYNLPQLITKLNEGFQAAAAASDGVVIRCAADTAPSEVSNKIVFTCSSPFCFLMDSSTIRHVIGFGDPVNSSSTDYTYVKGWSINRTGNASGVFCSLPASDIPDDEPKAATQGPVPAGPSRYQYQQVYGTRKVRQHFTALATGRASSVAAYVTVVGLPTPATMTARIVRTSDDVVMCSGVVSGTDIAGNGTNDVYEPVRFVMTSDGEVLLENEKYYVEFSAPDGTSQAHAGVYYNTDNLPVSGDRYMEVYADSSSGWTIIDTVVQACCDVIVSSWGHAIRSPGLVNLTGPRYVNIRCPEIESHMFRDRAYEPCHAGLGMVQLRGSGYQQQRFDFVSFPPRRFHALGRLDKLTIRLERPDGTLYDSKGVDHTLLLVVRFMTVAKDDHKDASSRVSTLNPDYVADLVAYQVQQRWPAEARAMDRTMKRY